jgi:hypothetical protein
MNLTQKPLHPGMTFYTPTKTSTVRLNPEFLRPLNKATRPITDFAEQLRQRRDDLDQMTRFAADEGPGMFPASATYVVPQPPVTTVGHQPSSDLIFGRQATPTTTAPPMDTFRRDPTPVRQHSAFTDAVNRVVDNHYARAPPAATLGATALPSQSVVQDPSFRSAPRVSRVSPVQPVAPTPHEPQTRRETTINPPPFPPPSVSNNQTTLRQEVSQTGQPPMYHQIPSVNESPQHQQPPQQHQQEEVPPPMQPQQLIPPPYLYETPAGRPEQRQHVRFERDERRRHRRDSTSSEDEDEDDNPNLPITERIPGNAYFDTLPAPWNVRPVPRSRHDRNASVDKADALKRLKLTGSVGSYLSWRPTFISYVHIRPVRLYEKCQAMMNSIDSTEPQLEPVITILRERQGDAYRRAIEELENRFGGIDRVRDHYLDRLDAHPPVKVEDFYSLDVFITFISSIHDAFRQNDLEYEMRSGKFVRTIKDKIPASYLDRYQEWMAFQHPGQRQLLFSLPTLVTWLKDKRERIRQLQKDVQSKAKANKKSTTTTRQFLTLEDALDWESDQDSNEPVQQEPEVQQADDVEQIYVTREGRQLVPTCTLCPGTKSPLQGLPQV